MSHLPFSLQRVRVPPIKCQGIKTRLVGFLLSNLHWQGSGARWIEPFLGSGVVALNLRPERALLADSNQHIIRFYQEIQQGQITGAIVETFLKREGEKLAQSPDYYYEVRERFNHQGSSLDFLFLNRSCFNGVMRFNRKGQFNVPFCHKPQRFSPSYITKIVNQVNWAAQQIRGKNWEFRVAPWQDTLRSAHPPDFIYLDPPYIGRHADYYNTWTQAEAEELARVTQQLSCGFAVSMWLSNQYRHNDHIQKCWATLEQRTYQHFYHVGASQELRGAIAEALLIKPGFAVPSNFAPGTVATGEVCS